MKQLILVRHAKSSWKLEGLEDIYRPLNERGYTEGAALAEWFSTHKLFPECILSSPAVRTYTTALIIAKANQLPISSIHLFDALYESEPDNYLSQIIALEDTLTTVALIGHNDTISKFLHRFEAPGSLPLSTGTGALLRFETDKWSRISNLTPEVRRIP